MYRVLESLCRALGMAFRERRIGKWDRNEEDKRRAMIQVGTDRAVLSTQKSSKLGFSTQTNT